MKALTQAALALGLALGSAAAAPPQVPDDDASMKGCVP